MAPGRRGRPARDAAPRVYLRRGVYAADLRRWNAGRITLRDPDAAGWPNGGDTTSNSEVAVRWALAYVDHFREERRRGQLKLGPLPKRLGEAADVFIDQRRHSNPTTTWQGNRSALNALRRFVAVDRESGCAGDELRTDRITAALLQRFFDGLARTGYAVNTLRAYRQAISVFLDSIGHGRSNAAGAARIPDQAHEEVYLWSDGDLERLRRAAQELDGEHPWFRAHELAIECALATGLRRNELFAIDWSRFDLETRTLRVVRQLDKSHRGTFVPPKSKRARTVLVLPGWWEHHREEGRGLLFTAADGGPISPRQPSHIMRSLLERAELDRTGLGWHTFRHTYARDFIVGVRGDFGLLQKSLGHRSITTTERLYGHLHEDVAAGLARARIYPEERLRAL